MWPCIIPVSVISTDNFPNTISHMETAIHSPEQIVLSQALTHMVLLTHIGSGSSCHFPCGPVKQTDGNCCVDIWPRNTSPVNSAALIAVHVFSRSLSNHMSQCICVGLTDPETGFEET